MNELERVYAIAYLSRHTLLQRGDVIRESCIATTKIAYEVMRGMGILARPMVVSVMAFNPPMAKRLHEGQEPVPGNAERWFAEDGAWSVGVSHDPTPNQGAFSGHMALIVKNRYLVDASLDQASRPQRGLTLGPCITSFSDSEEHSRFMRGGIEGRVATENASGNVLIYEAFPDDRSYRGSRDWKLWQQRYADQILTVSRTIGWIESGELPNDFIDQLEAKGLPEAPSNPDLLRAGPFHRLTHNDRRNNERGNSDVCK